MGIDPRDITPVHEGPPVAEDRKCASCNYSLKGLRVGMRCPECGQPILSAAAQGRESLTDAPIGYLKSVRFGFGLLFWSLLAITAYIIIFGGSASLVVMVVAGLVTLTWWLGVLIVTEPRLRPGLSQIAARARNRKLRLTNRVLQSFWAAWVGLGTLAIHGTPSGSTAQSIFLGVAWLCSMIAGVGMIALVIQLIDFAHWTSNSALVERLRLCAWGLGISTPLVLSWPGFVAITNNAGGVINSMVAIMVVPIAFLAFFGFQALLLVSLYQLWDSARWAVRNWAEARAKEKRQRDKAERHAQQAAAAPAPGEAAQLSRVIAPGPMAEAAPIELAPPRADGTGPYDLAP